MWTVVIMILATGDYDNKSNEGLFTYFRKRMKMVFFYKKTR